MAVVRRLVDQVAKSVVLGATMAGLLLVLPPRALAVETKELWTCTRHEELFPGYNPRERLLDVLFPAGSPATSRRVVVEPAFDPEWAILVDCRSEDGPRIEYHLALESVAEANWVSVPSDDGSEHLRWSDSPVPVESVTISRPISVDACLAVEALWAASLEDPHDWYTPGCDGTTYVFLSGTGDDLACGEIWSPDDRWVFLRELVRFVSELREFVTCETSCDTDVSDDAIARRAKQLAEYRVRRVEQDERATRR